MGRKAFYALVSFLLLISLLRFPGSIAPIVHTAAEWLGFVVALWGVFDLMRRRGRITPMFVVLLLVAIAIFPFSPLLSHEPVRIVVRVVAIVVFGLLSRREKLETPADEDTNTPAEP